MKKEHWLITLAAGAGVAAVAYSLLSKDIPEGATAVQPFDLNRYMGKWNEIARMPSRIEKDIKDLTEDYSLNNDGTFKVITKGFNVKKNKWTEVSGKGKYAGATDCGMLKVSYFGPFYLAYNVIDLDADYRYALVSGSSLDYLWILSKEATIPGEVKTQFLNKAKEIGFATEKLEWV